MELRPEGRRDRKRHGHARLQQKCVRPTQRESGISVYSRRGALDFSCTPSLGHEISPLRRVFENVSPYVVISGSLIESPSHKSVFLTYSGESGGWILAQPVAVSLTEAQAEPEVDLLAFSDSVMLAATRAISRATERLRQKGIPRAGLDDENNVVRVSGDAALTR